MKRKTRLLASAAMGAMAAVLAWGAIHSARSDAEVAKQEAAARYGGDLVGVCVAKRAIDPGEKIDEGNTEVLEWVSTMLPEDAVTSLSKATGRVATSHIPAHTPLAEAYFERADSALEVPRGKVAVSVASDAEHAVGGVLVRGQEVDVYASKDSVANKLMSAEVVDTSSLSENGGDLTWVTLAVRPNAVRELLAAASRGMVTLAVSNDPDSDKASGKADGKDGADADAKKDTSAKKAAASKSDVRSSDDRAGSGDGPGSGDAGRPSNVADEDTDKASADDAGDDSRKGRS